MARGALAALALVAVCAGAAFWFLSRPDPVAAGAVAADGDAARGERIFNLGGCASCHAAPGAEGEARRVLAGGLSLATPLGAIVVPNISPDPEHGIGGWTLDQFASAVTRGVSPKRTWYTPAFPWTSYRNMTAAEVADLYAYLKTLPPSANAPAADGLPFPFSWRRPIGLWQRFALEEPPAAPSDSDPAVAAGYHLVVAMGHCGECHTPRTALLAMDSSRWLQGAPNPAGKGKVPGIAGGATADWSAEDVANLLETGFTPEYDSVGGAMAEVVRNWAAAPPEDRAAVAAYLKALPGT